MSRCHGCHKNEVWRVCGSHRSSLLSNFDEGKKSDTFCHLIILIRCVWAKALYLVLFNATGSLNERGIVCRTDVYLYVRGKREGQSLHETRTHHGLFLTLCFFSPSLFFLFLLSVQKCSLFLLPPSSWRSQGAPTTVALICKSSTQPFAKDSPTADFAES